MTSRCPEPAGGGGGDAGGRGHHEEGGAFSEDHPSVLRGHADRLHPAVCAALLHGLPHAESVRGQPLPGRAVRVSPEPVSPEPVQHLTIRVYFS